MDNNKVSKVVLLVVLFLMLAFSTRCASAETTTEEQQQQTVEKQQKIENFIIKNITEISYDGCQYLYHGAGYRAGLTHKGNCNNVIHAYTQGQAW